MTNSEPNSLPSSERSDPDLSRVLEDPRAREILGELNRRKEVRELSSSLYRFLKASWHLVEPAVFVDGWHIRAICSHLEAVARGEIRSLLINVPPRHAKSLIVSCFFPAWRWTWEPRHRFLFASYAESLSVRDSLKTRELVKSEWYQSRWPDVKIKADQDQKTRFDLATGGYRIASSVGGSTTGEGGDTIVVDDAHALDDAFSDANREAALRWWSNTMSSRLNDRLTGSRVVIGQRIHEADLSGHLLANEKADWAHLCLPAEYVPGKTYSNPLGWKDPRTTAGELLWPERFPEKEQQKIKVSSGSYSYSGQQQQDPQPAEGSMFSAKYFRYFSREESVYLLHAPAGIKRVPVDSVMVFQCFDTAIKTKETNDYTVCLTGGITLENDLLVLDVVRERIPVPEQYGFTVRMRQRFPRVVYQFVEDKASGQGLIQEAARSSFPFLNLTERLKEREVPQLISGDKQQRALPVSIMYEAGKVFHLTGAPWLVDFEHELTHFPVGVHDDQVDALAYAGICLKFGPRLKPRSGYVAPPNPNACTCASGDFVHHPTCPQSGDAPPATWQDELAKISPLMRTDWRSAFPGYGGSPR
jgi:predicted phage terminase large subunit-like protein